MKKVYFNEYNIPMGRTVYLPLVSGMLTAYAKTFPLLRESYEFMQPIYERDTPTKILEQYEDPAVACFSVCLWNYNLSLEVARLVKEKWPTCTVIFGGPSAPFESLPANVDYVINGEGEKKFVNILCPGLVDEGQEKDLDIYPSPYTSGEYDSMLGEMNFQAIIETNRGCPFTCTYCFWGQGGLSQKMRFHSLDHIRDEAEWIGRNKIKYVFCADANFGMFGRDVEVAKIYAAVKKKYGYPDKFRVCYGKNAQESIYKTAKILHKAGLAKAITLSKQTNNPDALKNIRRSNIKSSVYDYLQERYNAEDIPTYVELILGLPGETLQSFKNGVQEAIKTKTNLLIYHCSVLPNTEMAKEAYKEKHGIKTIRLPMCEIHCSPRGPGAVQEYEDIIIGTNTMTTEEWIEAAVYSWMIQLRYSLGVNCKDNEIVPAFYRIAREITEGKARGQIDEMFGDIYWEPEELAYLKIMYKDGDPVKFAREHILYGRKG